ncbi:MAG TPA: TRAP transporter small permease [Burkholderiales bacterium]|nr:TRAP transporter small permease [Burkholderiales bacterium]
MRALTPRWIAANVLEIALGVMLLAICIIVFAGVFFRYFLHIGLGWTEELARYLQIWMTFVGATVAVKRWAHFQLTLIQQWIPTGAGLFTRVFAIAVVMALAAMLVKNGVDITRVAWNQSSPVMGWRIGYLYLIAPISGTLMLLFCVRHLVAAVRAR